MNRMHICVDLINLQIDSGLFRVEGGVFRGMCVVHVKEVGIAPKRNIRWVRKRGGPYSKKRKGSAEGQSSASGLTGSSSVADSPGKYGRNGRASDELSGLEKGTSRPGNSSVAVVPREPNSRPLAGMGNEEVVHFVDGDGGEGEGEEDEIIESRIYPSSETDSEVEHSGEKGVGYGKDVETESGPALGSGLDLKWTNVASLVTATGTRPSTKGHTILCAVFINGSWKVVKLS